jgi:GTP-binding protein HflX
MGKAIITKEKAERTVLVGVIKQDQNESEVDDYLAELALLASTAGAEPVGRFTQKLDKPNSKTFIGSGKLAELVTYIKDKGIDIAIFDDDLSPSQLRNIERTVKCRVLDRTNLILDIFATRAKTAHAKTQVELAQYQYLLPRLTGLWTHLERQKGGIGLRGPGETEIETDRRIIRDKISRLEKHLKKIDKQMSTQRKNRGKLVRVALVGYTNAGKSTLMNLLSKSELFAEDKLFATLDTTVRKIIIGNLPFLMADTVGFIRKLPHHLVESFKSTLDEVREADILIHLVDISHPNFEEQIVVVNQTLNDLKIYGKPSIVVFNKNEAYSFIQKDEDDLTLSTKENLTLDELKKTWMARKNASSVFVSALKETNIPELKEILYKKVKEIHRKRYPYNDYLY